MMRIWFGGMLMMILCLLLQPFGSRALTGSVDINRSLMQESIKRCVVTPPINNAYTKKIDALVKLYHKKNKFHGNILVTKKGQPLYSNAIGYSNLGTKEELDIHNAFQLASVSKQFTAVGIMMLAEKGLVKYDDPVSNYVCELNYPGMTIRQLLNHTSGIQNYMWLLEKKWPYDHNPSNKEVIQFMSENKLPLNFTPGTRFSYSNTGYMVLAYIIEKVSEMPYATFIDNHIFHPLEMHDAFVEGTDDPYRTKNKVFGYKPCKRGYYRVGNSVNDGAHGDKGIYASIVDLFKWDQALNNHTLVSSSTMKQALTQGTLKNKYRIPYGFGFRLRVKNGYPTVYHHGIWNGYRTSIVKNQSKQTTIVVLNHTNSKTKDNLVRAIEKILES